MSLCLRNIPNKVTPFVNTRKQVTKIDHHLPKHIKSSLFLEEFLNIPATAVTYTAIDHAKKSMPVTYFDAHTEWSSLANKTFNWNKQTTWMQQHRKTNIPTLSRDDADIINGSAFNNNFQWLDSYIDRSWLHPKNKSCLSHNERLSNNRNLVNSTCLEEQNVFYSKSSPSVQNVEEKQTPSGNHKPSEEQLQNVFNSLREDLPLVFVRTLNYHIYTEDLVFVNNIKGTVTTGVLQYMKQVAWLRLLGHIKFAYVKLQILKMTSHPEDSSIKVRWRIIGMSGTRIFLTFWKLKAWQIRQQAENESDLWYDGFSTFYVNNDGKVFKHVVDKLMPDQNDFKEKLKTPVAAKLALIVPLLTLNSCNSIIYCLDNESK
ncbi:uncharacterized protein LOC144474416 [Augochlora pura]